MPINKVWKIGKSLDARPLVNYNRLKDCVLKDLKFIVFDEILIFGNIDKEISQHIIEDIRVKSCLLIYT